MKFKKICALFALFSLCFTAALCSCAAVSEEQAYLESIAFPRCELAEGEVSYVGRWFEEEIGGVPHMVTVNDGSQMFFMTEGASAAEIEFTVITEKETPYFAWSIDGGDFVRQEITSPRIPLDGERHVVRVVVDSIADSEDKWGGKGGVAVRGVKTVGGTLRAVLPKNKKLMFFGDSITEGGRVFDAVGSAPSMSVTNAYPQYCARALGAIDLNVGYCASGIFERGSFATCLETIDRMTQTIYCDDADVPDMIVLNHGTNDIFYGSAEFRTGYAKVLLRLQQKYVGRPIVCMIPFNQKHANDIRIVAAAFDNCFVVETEGWPLTFTDGLHPDVNGSKVAGAALAEALTDIFGEEFFDAE